MSSGTVAVIKGQVDMHGSSKIVSGEIASNSTREYEGQFPCNSGTSFKCPAANW